MYCGKCGKEIREGTAFCPYCGEKQNAGGAGSNITENSSGDLNNGGAGQNSSNAGGRHSSLPNWAKWLIVAAAVVVVAVVVIIIVASNSRVTIDMNKYLVVSESGYNGYGSVGYHVDVEQMKADYAGKLKLTSEGNSNLAFASAVAQGEDPVDLIYYDLDVYPDVSSGLSNGDKVTFRWNNSNVSMLETYIKVSIKTDNYVYTVSDLEDAENEDFFNYVSVDISGTAPNGRATIDVDCNWLDDNDFTISNKEGLSNGDTITVTLNDSSLYDILQMYGKAPIETSREYTVNGLDEYVTSVSQIPDGDMAEMKTETENYLKDHLMNGSDDWQTTINDLNFIGCYLVGTFSNYTEGNTLYFVYHVNETNSWNDDTHTVDYYTFMAYNDVMLKDGGTLYKSDCIAPDYSFEGNKLVGPAFIIDFNGEETLYRGMESLNDLKNEFNKSGELLDSTLSE